MGKNVALEKFKFTQDSVAAIPLVETGKRYVYDTVVPGLCVRVTPKEKFYSVRVSVAASGRSKKVDVQRKISGGNTKLMTVTIARDAALVLIGELKNGVDESKSNREKKRAERAAASLPAATPMTFDQALEDHLGKNRKIPLKQRTIDDSKGLLSRELKSLKGLPMADIDRAMVDSLHASIGVSAPTRRNYALRMMRAVCLGWNKTETLKDWSGMNLSTTPRQTNLEPSDGPLIYRELHGRLNTHPSARFALAMLLTGCRHGELAGLKVGDVNRVAMSFKLRDTKNHTDHTVYMSSKVAELLLPMTKDTFGDDRDPSANVFLASTDTRFVFRLVEESLAGVWGGSKHITNHCTRKLCAITLNHLRFPAATIMGVLNHRPPASNTLLSNYIGNVPAADLRSAWKAVAEYYSATSNIVHLPIAQAAA